MTKKYHRCAVCGRSYHESMGSTSVCCFCYQKSRAGMVPVKVADKGFVLWVKRWIFKAGMEAVASRVHYTREIENISIEAYTEASFSCLTKFFMDHLSTGEVLIRGRTPYDEDRVVFHWGYHKFMWGTFAKYPNLKKYEVWWWMCDLFPEIGKIHEGRANYCFACDAAKDAAERDFGHDSDCDYCPLVWLHGDNVTTCFADGSLYDKWCTSSNTSEVVRTAVSIKNLTLMEPLATNCFVIDD